MPLDNALLRHYNAFMQSKRTRAYRAVYGGAVLSKSWCRDCRAFSFVLNGLLVCCSTPHAEAPEQWKRESLACGIRHKPPKEYQEAQLERQAHRCFYCFIRFDSSVRYNKRVCRLMIQWDHIVPFAYLQTNPAENFVAACQICNHLKAAKVFQTVEEARSYVQIKRSLTI